MKSKNQSFLRTISGITLFFFTSTSLAWGAPGGIVIAPKSEMPSFLQIEIPEDLASIEEIYEAPPQTEPKLILHIQNVHGNYEAQVQIKKLLQFLHEKYAFKLMFAEGAVEKLNPEYLNLFPEKERNLELADYLAKQGELTGIEYYLIDGPKDVEAVGIEKAELYRQNYEAFKKVYGARSEIDLYLSQFEQKLEMLSSRIFPQDTRRILSEWKKFEAGQRDFLPFVKRLAEDAKKITGLDLESLFAQVEWPQITRLLVLQSMEADLNRAQAEKEQARLIEFLKSKRVAKEIVEAIGKLGAKHITMSRLDEKDKRLEDLPRYLLERLVEEAGPKGFYFHDYPAFSLWAGYLILQAELDSRVLFEEIERVFQKVLDTLTVTELEKNLMELFRDSELLRKLLHLEVTRKEWDRVLYRKDWIQPKAIWGRLEKVSEEMSPGAAALNGGEAKSADVTSSFETALSFYEFARQRESVFYETIQQEMKTRKTEKAVLVTGGFHTEGLMEIFRERQINYSILTPRLVQQVDNSNYVSAMLETRPTMFDIANIESPNTIQPWSALGKMGRSKLFEVKRMVSGWVEITRSTRSNEQYLKDLDRLVAHFNSSRYASAERGGRAAQLVRSETRNAYQVVLDGSPLVNSKNKTLKIPVDEHGLLSPFVRRGEAVATRSKIRMASKGNDDDPVSKIFKREAQRLINERRVTELVEILDREFPEEEKVNLPEKDKQRQARALYILVQLDKLHFLLRKPLRNVSVSNEEALKLWPAVDSQFKILFSSVFAKVIKILTLEGIKKLDPSFLDILPEHLIRSEVRTGAAELPRPRKEARDERGEERLASASAAGAGVSGTYRTEEGLQPLGETLLPLAEPDTQAGSFLPSPLMINPSANTKINKTPIKILTGPRNEVKKLLANPAAYVMEKMASAARWIKSLRDSFKNAFWVPISKGNILAFLLLINNLFHKIKERLRLAPPRDAGELVPGRESRVPGHGFSRSEARAKKAGGAVPPGVVEGGDSALADFLNTVNVSRRGHHIVVVTKSGARYRLSLKAKNARIIDGKAVVVDRDDEKKDALVPLSRIVQVVAVRSAKDINEGGRLLFQRTTPADSRSAATIPISSAKEPTDIDQNSEDTVDKIDLQKEPFYDRVADLQDGSWEERSNGQKFRVRLKAAEAGKIIKRIGDAGTAEDLADIDSILEAIERRKTAKRAAEQVKPQPVPSSPSSPRPASVNPPPAPAPPAKAGKKVPAKKKRASFQSLSAEERTERVNAYRRHIFPPESEYFRYYNDPLLDSARQRDDQIERLTDYAAEVSRGSPPPGAWTFFGLRPKPNLKLEKKAGLVLPKIEKALELITEQQGELARLHRSFEAEKAGIRTLRPAARQALIWRIQALEAFNERLSFAAETLNFYLRNFFIELLKRESPPARESDSDDGLAGQLRGLHRGLNQAVRGAVVFSDEQAELHSAAVQELNEAAEEEYRSRARWWKPQWWDAMLKRRLQSSRSEARSLDQIPEAVRRIRSLEAIALLSKALDKPGQLDRARPIVVEDLKNAFGVGNVSTIETLLRSLKTDRPWFGMGSSEKDRIKIAVAKRRSEIWADLHKRVMKLITDGDLEMLLLAVRILAAAHSNTVFRFDSLEQGAVARIIKHLNVRDAEEAQQALYFADNVIPGGGARITPLLEAMIETRRILGGSSPRSEVRDMRLMPGELLDSQDNLGELLLKIQQGTRIDSNGIPLAAPLEELADTMEGRTKWPRYPNARAASLLLRKIAGRLKLGTLGRDSEHEQWIKDAIHEAEQYHDQLARSEVRADSDSISGLIAVAVNADFDSVEREMAVRELSRRYPGDDYLEKNRIIQTLIELLKDKDFFVQLAAAQGLVEFGPDAKAAVTSLIQILEPLEIDPEYSDALPRQAVIALGKIGPEAISAVPILIQVAASLKHRTYDDGPQRAISAGPYWGSGYYAPVALARIASSDERVLDLLHKLLSDPDPRTRQMTLTGWERVLERNGTVPDFARTQMQQLSQNDSDEHVKRSALRLLSLISRSEARVPVGQTGNETAAGRAAQVAGRRPSSNEELRQALEAMIVALRTAWKVFYGANGKAQRKGRIIKEVSSGRYDHLAGAIDQAKSEITTLLALLHDDDEQLNLKTQIQNLLHQAERNAALHANRKDPENNPSEFLRIKNLIPRLKLHRSEVRHQPGDAPARPDESRQEAPLRVLVVDDEEMVRNVTGSAVKQSLGDKVRVHFAKDAEDALAKIRDATEPYHLGIFDVDMPPGENGLKLAQTAKALSPTTVLVLQTGRFQVHEEAAQQLIAAKVILKIFGKPYKMLDEFPKLFQQYAKERAKDLLDSLPNLSFLQEFKAPDLLSSVPDQVIAAQIGVIAAGIRERLAGAERNGEVIEAERIAQELAEIAQFFGARSETRPVLESRPDFYRSEARGVIDENIRVLSHLNELPISQEKADEFFYFNVFVRAYLAGDPTPSLLGKISFWVNENAQIVPYRGAGLNPKNRKITAEVHEGGYVKDPVIVETEKGYPEPIPSQLLQAIEMNNRQVPSHLQMGSHTFKIEFLTGEGIRILSGEEILFQSLEPISPDVKLTVGRDDTDDISFGGDKVLSKHHAAIQYDVSKGDWTIKDLESLNGIWINGKKYGGKRKGSDWTSLRTRSEARALSGEDLRPSAFGLRPVAQARSREGTQKIELADGFKVVSGRLTEKDFERRKIWDQATGDGASLVPGKTPAQIFQQLPPDIRKATFGQPDLKRIYQWPVFMQLLALTRGILGLTQVPPAEAAQVQVLESYARSIAPPNPYLEALQPAIDKFPQILTSSENPGLLAFVTAKAPTLEDLENIRKILLTQKKQFLRLIFPEGALSPEELQNVEKIKAAIFGKFEGEIGIRFSIAVAGKPQVLTEIPRAVYRAMTQWGINTIGSVQDLQRNHYVQWVDASARLYFDLETNADPLAKIFESTLGKEQPEDYPGLLALAGALAMQLSQGVEASQLNQKVIDALSQRDKHISFIVDHALRAFARNFAQALRSGLRIRTAA